MRLLSGRCLRATPDQACLHAIDLEDRRQVTLKEGKEYASSVGALFLETSALRATGVVDLFERLGKAVGAAWGSGGGIEGKDTSWLCYV